MQWLVLKQYAWPSEMVPHIIGEACQLPLSPTTVQIPNIQREKRQENISSGQFLTNKTILPTNRISSNPCQSENGSNVPIIKLITGTNLFNCSQPKYFFLGKLWMY
jgi:hypothetical protein